ncbi:MAG: CPBP family intramembrane metalloprotease [Chitinophagaceae bacterium]|nr:MAG: CPBP family intramembrane metalloprotease [Chitinophagaceae bacterium]
MSTSKKSVFTKGWMRVLFFLVVFAGVYISGSWLYSETGFNKTINPVYAGAAIFGLAALLTVPAFIIFADNKPLSSLGFKWMPVDSPGYEPMPRFIAPLMAVAILGVGWTFLYLSNYLEYLGAILSTRNILTGFLLMCVIAVAEESVFRGYVLNNLLSSFNPWLSLVISAMLFAFLHSGNPEAGIVAIINVFLAGLLLGINYIYTRNLWFATLFHLSWNFLQGPVLGFPVSGLDLPAFLQISISGNELITGGKFGFEGSIIQTILFIPAIIILYLSLHPGFSPSTSTGNGIHRTNQHPS